MQPVPLFPVGTLAGSDDVVDREQFMADATAQLASGQSLVIAGPRRIGKTSVSQEILRRLAREGFYTAYVDLFLVTNVEALAAAITQAVLENRVGLANRAIRTWTEVKDWVASLTLRQRLAGAELELSLHVAHPTPEQMLVAAINLAEHLAARDGRRLVMLFDEFQDVERLGATPLVQRLRALFQEQRHSTYLFLGSQADLLRTLFTDRRQALYRFALLMDLPPVAAADWLKYLQRKFLAVGLNISAQACADLIRRTGGHPYGVMQVANRTYLAAEAADVRDVTADLVAAAYEDVLRVLDRVFEEE